MKVKSESEVAQSCPTLRDPMDCSLPGSSAHGVFQARVLEWGAIAFSKPSYCHVANNSISFFLVSYFSLQLYLVISIIFKSFLYSLKVFYILYVLNNIFAGVHF